MYSADEGTTESIKFKPEEVDDIEDKIVKVFFFRLSAATRLLPIYLMSSLVLYILVRTSILVL
jgi:hypothetical protein